MRYTEHYRKLVNECVDFAALAAIGEQLRERREDVNSRKYLFEADVRAKLNAANVVILRERMKTLSGDELERAQRTIDELEAASNGLA